MDIKIIIIIILVGLSFYQFAYPEKSKETLEPVWGSLSQSAKNFSLFNKDNSTNEFTCPENFNPVCGTNGITYDNTCFAMLDDMLDVVVGEC